MHISIVLELTSQLWLGPDLSLHGLERKSGRLQKIVKNRGFNQIQNCFRRITLQNMLIYLRPKKIVGVRSSLLFVCNSSFKLTNAMKLYSFPPIWPVTIKMYSKQLSKAPQVNEPMKANTIFTDGGFLLNDKPFNI